MADVQPAKGGRLTGWHVLAITCSAFGVIIAVNLFMAFKAVSTFSGVEVANSYVASQEFDIRRRAQEALGWSVEKSYRDGRFVIAFQDAEGRPVEVRDLQVLIGRKTSNRDDVTPELTWLGGLYEAQVPLAPGLWMMRISAKSADGTLFEQRGEMIVEG